VTKAIDFQTDPSRYRHWRVAHDGDVATLAMDVDENGGLFDGYVLKLNSYDLGVDIELADIVQRMRFEHPEVKVVVLRTPTRSISASSPTRRATPSRRPRRIPGSNTSARSKAPAPAAATSSRWPATTSC